MGQCTKSHQICHPTPSGARNNLRTTEQIFMIILCTLTEPFGFGQNSAKTETLT
jgi:hypothetical protein